MDDLNMTILSGGFYHCTSSWSKSATKADNCYKLYFPIEGEACVKVNGKYYDIQAGKTYLINGFKLEKQICQQYMDVFWVHFVPQSLYIRKHLDSVEPVFIFNKGDIPVIENINLDYIPILFDNPSKESNIVKNNVPLYTTAYLSSIILLITSYILQKQYDINDVFHQSCNKLKPALDYMNQHYTNNPSLSDISNTVFLCPTYFLRLFKRIFNTTPHQYLLTKKLNESCNLLHRTEMSVKEISNTLGFCNQFYFAKVFKEHFLKTPSEYRKSKPLP